MMATYESLTVSDVADLLGVHTTTIERWLRSGELPGAKFGGRWAVPVEGVCRWLEGRQLFRVRVGLHCQACGYGTLDVDPARPPQRMTCSARCGNHIAAADLRRLELVCHIAGAGRAERALQALNGWAEEARGGGRNWRPTLVDEGTLAEDRVVADYVRGGPEPDLEAARREAYAMAARLWEPEDSIFDDWEPEGAVSVQ